MYQDSGFGERQFQKCRIYSTFVADTSLQTKAKWLKKGKIIKPPAVSPCLQFYPKALCRHLAKRSKSPMNKGFGKALQMLWMSLHALLERTRGSMLSECPCLQVQVDLPFRSSFEFKELPDEKNRPNVNFNLRQLPGLSQRPHGQPPRNQRLHPRRPWPKLAQGMSAVPKSTACLCGYRYSILNSTMFYLWEYLWEVVASKCSSTCIRKFLLSSESTTVHQSIPRQVQRLTYNLPKLQRRQTWGLFREQTSHMF